MSNDREPIELNEGMLSSFISLMLMRQGETEVTMSFEEYNERKLEDYCIQSWCVRGDDESRPDSVTCCLVAVKDLPPDDGINLADLLRQLGAEE